MHRQGDDTVGDSLRHGQHAAYVPVLCKGGLQMDRYRVVNASSYSFLLKCLTEKIALPYLYDIDVIDMCCPGENHWNSLDYPAQLLCIEIGVCLPSRIPLLQVAQLHPSHSGL